MKLSTLEKIRRWLDVAGIILIIAWGVLILWLMLGERIFIGGFLFVLGIIVLAAYWYESTPWRWCPRCGFWRNIKTGKEYNYAPRDCDGIAKRRECESCQNKPSKTH